MGYPDRAREIYAQEDNRPIFEAIKLAEGGRIFSIEELRKFGDKASEIILAMAKQKNFLCADDLIKLNITSGPFRSCASGWYALRIMAFNGCEFTTEEIIQLGDVPKDELKKFRPISIWMAIHGHFFTFDDIIRLNNPADKYGATLAHWQARSGYRFSVDELIKLGNRRINYSKGEIFYYDLMQPLLLTVGDISEDEQYENMTELLHNGATIAHIMAREGYKFTDEEIEKLGNPRDAEGLSLKDWMEKAAGKDETDNS